MAKVQDVERTKFKGSKAPKPDILKPPKRGLGKLVQLYDLFLKGDIVEVDLVSLNHAGEASIGGGGGLQLDDHGMIRGTIKRAERGPFSEWVDLATSFMPLKDVQLVVNPNKNEVALGDSILTDLVCANNPAFPNSVMLWGRAIPKNKGLGKVFSTVHYVISFVSLPKSYRS